MTRSLVALALGAALASAAAADDLERYELRATSVEGCPGLPVPRGTRELWSDGERAVDVHARFWTLDRPASYHGRTAVAHYRVGNGSLRVESELSPDRSEETLRVAIERPIATRYRRAYLAHIALPCERRTRYAVRELSPAAGDLGALARFDALLLESTELLYDERYAEAEERLLRAAALRPQDPAPFWMLARARYLALERAAVRGPEELRRYAEAEGWAATAVERAPLRAEGWLWHGAIRGRIATASGDLRAALATLSGRGPRFVEHALRQAVSLPEEYRFLADSTRNDALHALAQYYRLAPDAWYMTALGTRGDLARAIELSGEAVRAQPERIDYRTEHASALLCRGSPADRERAQRELEAALELPAISPLDVREQARARRLLADQGPPCGSPLEPVAQEEP
jgi:hypothetical protein